ncbi:MAG: HD domain-containing protein, partial [Candidatus Woesearchaeota archaeon]
MTRASHTEIVTNLSEGLARGLSLNEDLAKAIAKGHDIGHTAFGHAGEEELEQICQEEFCYCKVNDLKTKDATMYVELERKYGPLNDENLRKKVPVLERVLKEEFMNQLKREFFVQVKDTRIFLHAKQSFRLLCVLEGKKLTAQTVHGIISHNYPWDEYGNWEIDQTEKIKRIEDPNPLKQRNPLAFVIEQYKVNKEHQTYEGQVVKFADFLAFAIHDLDDALRAEKLKLSDLEARFKQKFPGLDFDEYLVGP